MTSLLLLTLLLATSQPPSAGRANGDILASANLNDVYKFVLYGDSVDKGDFYAKERLTLYRKSSGGWQKVQQLETTDKDEYMEYGRLIFGDFERDGSTEVAMIVDYNWTTGGGNPESAHLFRFVKGNLAETDRLDSNEELMVKWLGDGRTAFFNSFEVGPSLSHAAMPRWQDAYVVRAGRFRLLETGLPAFYRRWAARLCESLKDDLDADVWAYLGIAYRRAGMTVSAPHLARYFLRQARHRKASPNVYNGADPIEFWRELAEQREWPKPKQEQVKYHEAPPLRAVALGGNR